MNIFQVYKIILGLIVAAFVIFFVTNFLGDYVGLNTQTMTYKAMNELRDKMNDVYITGNSIEFSLLTKKGTPDCFVGSGEEYTSTEIKCGSLGMSFFTPLFFTEGGEGKLFINRNYLDFGWSKFYAVSITPEMIILFVPENSAAKDKMLNITDALKENENIKFAICDNEGITDLVDGDSFLTSTPTETSSSCTASLGGVYRIVKISSNCNNDGICIEINSKTISLDGERLNYEDVLDMLAVIIGGTEKDAFGVNQGKVLFIEKNKVLKNQLLVQIALENERAVMLKNEANIISESIDDVLYDIDIFVGSLNNEISTLDPTDDYDLIVEKEELVENYNDCEYAYSNLKTYITTLQNELQSGDDKFAIKTIVSDAKSLYTSQIENVCQDLSTNAKSKLICSALRFELVDILNNVKTSILNNDPYIQYMKENSKPKYEKMEDNGCN
ncbi:MAG: hypothetical protein KKB03_03705 [Nanoarchaeota archaeon]|nr:hypothetical protein [Nanoarchaeota archaeon]MBU1135033.1 hypothetical protein [Nanoarchaeota archaeon]MBU2520319.1 hypothetical protein [Nanoarchaeota archaeon]